MGTINTVLRKSKMNSQGLAPVVAELYDDRSGNVTFPENRSVTKWSFDPLELPP